jgi:hypothetical protein
MMCSTHVLVGQTAIWRGQLLGLLLHVRHYMKEAHQVRRTATVEDDSFFGIVGCPP